MICVTISQIRKPSTGMKYAIVVRMWPAWAYSTLPMFAGPKAGEDSEHER